MLREDTDQYQPAMTQGTQAGKAPHSRPVAWCLNRLRGVAGRLRPDKLEAWQVPWLLVVALVAGLILRVVLYFTDISDLDSDEAIVGWIARSFLHGHFSLFFWGQTYGGTLEPLLTAPLMAIFGSTVAILRITATLFTVATTIVLWRFARRIMPDRNAQLAAALYWVWPLVSVWWSMKAREFYRITPLLGLLLLVATLRLIEKPSRPLAFFFGLIVGLGMWQSYLIAFYVVPAVVYLAIVRFNPKRYWWLAGLGGVAGASPWLVYNVMHNWEAVALSKSQFPSSMLDRLWGLFAHVMPGALGLKTVPVLCETAGRCDWGRGWAIPYVAPVLYLAALAGFVYLVIRHSRQLALALLCLGLMPFIYILSNYTFFVATPKYLTVVLPVVALLLAARIKRNWMQNACLALALAVTVASMSLYNVHVPGRWADQDLIHYLESRNIHFGYADYWLANRITFESDLRVVLKPLYSNVPEQDSYETKARRSVYVVPADGHWDRSLTEVLTGGHVTFERNLVGANAVYVLQTVVKPDLFHIDWAKTQPCGVVSTARGCMWR